MRNDQANTSKQARSQNQIGIRNRSPGVDRAARTVEDIVQEIEYTASRVLIVVAERNLNLLDMPSFEVPAILGVHEEIGFAHIKVKIDRIKRHERREQCRRTCRCAAASNQIAHGNEMRAHAPCERRRNPAMVEVELRIPDPGLRVFDRSPSCALIGCALVYVFHASSAALLQILGTAKLSVSQLKTSRCNVELGSRLGERNLVGAGINGEKEVALPNNVPILEKYSCKCTAHLCAQLDLRNRRELAKEAQPYIDVLRQRLAHHHLWKRSGRSTGGTSARPRRILEPCT